MIDELMFYLPLHLIENEGEANIISCVFYKCAVP